MALSEWKLNHLYCAILVIWLAILALARKNIQKGVCVGKYNTLSKSKSLNYTLKLSKPTETPKNSQIFSLNAAYFCDKLYLLPNLFFKNIIPFWFSIQPEPHAVIDCLFFPCVLDSFLKTEPWSWDFWQNKQSNELYFNCCVSRFDFPPEKKIRTDSDGYEDDDLSSGGVGAPPAGSIRVTQVSHNSSD